MLRVGLLCGVAFLWAGVAQAEELATDADAAGQGHDRNAPGDYHETAGQDIIVTAPFRRDVGTLLSGISVMSGETLTRELRPTIGETLARQPGVSATSFGPNASRPILRGFQGDRVRILTDGIGSFDASSTSVDHPVVINPLTSERIEVLRGPSALLFGSSAVGGVVNVIDSRIPRRIPDEPIHVDGIASYGSAANERSISAGVESALTDKLVIHFDGSYSKTGNLETGGYILTPALRAEAAESDDPETAALADLKGKLPNSAARTWQVAAGAALITETGNFGFSVARYDSLYGIPTRYDVHGDEDHDHDHDHDHDDDHGGHGHDGQVRLDVKQTRVDVRGEVETGGGFLQSIKFRGGFADYQHDELEESGEIGTTFYNQGWEGRLELVQAEHGGWRGALGGQFLIRNLNVVGEEKFVPRNETQQFGLFTLQEVNLGAVKVEAGGRFEHSVLSAAADADLGNPNYQRTFDAISASLGAGLDLTDGWRVGVNLSRSERAPSAEELFANGPHAGTQSFEVGNPDFAKEKSWGLEATLRGKGEGYSFSASAFHSWFDDYIYESATGAEEDGLPVFQYAQADARYYGFEVEGSATLAHIGRTTIVADALADYVRATIKGDGPAPRIPPLRLLGGIEAQSEAVTGRVEVEWADDQKRVTQFETPTDGYTMVNASLAFRPFGSGNPTSIALSVNNIFDVVARRHVSVLKDYAPLAGRDVRITTRIDF
ncbi:iron complex outermembrane recepter protein [Sphingomonas laterariae]|uniref:Iron complex outermembrane recepter protein n=1 Tax=Edaphosphingomonas laterariae TaxID=861865 RepID=A0A239DVG7_9SPHN|nr:TonB-dependent receptor [Sphingomonas laterariae]SNS36585.1 iron complex outermembrane recepter protein [Sphingomonas laterariae]